MTHRRDVKRTYDRIAGHFDETRAHPWPEVEAFVAGLDSEGERSGPVDRATSEDATGRDEGRLPTASTNRHENRPTVGLDIGCGNCRHTVLLEPHVDLALGLDVSRPLLERGENRATNENADVTLLQGDATEVPLRSELVDVAIFVATLHHLPTAAHRRESLVELDRVLAPGGRALISVWSTEHQRFDREKGFDTTLEWTLPDGQTISRFFHIYDPEEFERTLATSPLSVLDLSVSHGNCYAEVRST